MRTLFVTTDCFGGYGGLAKYNRDLLTALCSYPSTTEVVAIPRLASDQRETLPPKLTFVTEGLGGKRHFLTAVARQVAQRARFDLVICGHINLLPPMVLVARRFGAPLILCVYGIDAWTRPDRLAPYACAGITGFASISRVTAERFREWAPLEHKKEWILPNAIELDHFSPGPKDPALLERYGLQGKTVIGTLGRLHSLQRQKGFDEVLDVLPRLVKTRPQLSYLVMGDGSDVERLKHKAASLGVTSHVVFTGSVPEHEKVLHYRLADAYVMPSRGEGFGFVFLEALACGIPVVASRLDGGREAVRGGSLGVLVDPTDQDDLIRGIDEALAKPAGVVPPGLSYFSFENFTSRVHAFADDVMSS